MTGVTTLVDVPTRLDAVKAKTRQALQAAAEADPAASSATK